MASNDTAALVVALSAQLTKFEKDMDQAVGIADKKTREIEGHFAKINPEASGLTSFFTKLTSVAGIAATIAGLKETVAEVAHLGASAERVGLSVAEIQKFRFAIVATGGDVNVADQFMDRFSKSISEAGQGSGELYKTLKLNNVVFKDSSGQLLPMNQQLDMFANLVKNTKSPQDQLNLAMLVGGRSAGPALVEALKRGAEGLKEFGIEAENAGVILEDSLVRRAKQINTQWDILWERIKAGSKASAVAAAEVADTLLNQQKSSARGIETEIKGIWDSLITYLNTHSPNFVGLVAGVKELLEDEQRKAAREGPRRGADITSPLGAGRVDERLEKVKVANTGLTKIFNEQDEAFKKLLLSGDQRIAMLAAEQAGIGLSEGKVAELKAAVELETRAKAENIPITRERAAAIADEAAKIGDATERLARANDTRPLVEYIKHAQNLKLVLSETAVNSMNTFTDGLTDIVMKTKTVSQAFHDMANAIIRDLVRMAIRQSIVAPIAGMLGLGGSGGFLSALFGGGVKSGGDAGRNAGGTDNWRGGMTWVGENGPELINLPRGSQVIPNDVARKSAGGAIIVNINSSPVFQAGMTPTDIASISAMMQQNNQRLRGQVQSDLRNSIRLDSDTLTRS